MTKEEMAKSHSDDFDNEIYKERMMLSFVDLLQNVNYSPSNLDEAEFEYAQSLDEIPANQEEEKMIYDAFKAGAEWMAGQGYIKEGIARPDDCEIWVNLTGTGIKDGDKIIVQIRKKEK